MITKLKVRGRNIRSWLKVISFIQTECEKQQLLYIALLPKRVIHGFGLGI